MSCYQTPTGVKFLVFSDPAMEQAVVEQKCRRLYEVYAEFVMRNPFQPLEMPVRSEKFERAVLGSVVAGR